MALGERDIVISIPFIKFNVILSYNSIAIVWDVRYTCNPIKQGLLGLLFKTALLRVL